MTTQSALILKIFSRSPRGSCVILDVNNLVIAGGEQAAVSSDHWAAVGSSLVLSAPGNVRSSKILYVTVLNRRSTYLITDVPQYRNVRGKGAHLLRGRIEADDLFVAFVARRKHLNAMIVSSVELKYAFAASRMTGGCYAPLPTTPVSA